MNLNMFLHCVWRKYYLVIKVLTNLNSNKTGFSFLFFCCCCLVTKLCPTLCHPMDCKHARFPFPSLSLRVCSNSCPLSQWCYLIISSFAAHFSFYPQYFPASGSFPMSIEDWYILVLTSLISLKSKGLSRVFSNATFWKHQFFGT